MQFTGKLDRGDEKLIQEFLVPLSNKLGHELTDVEGLVGQVAMQLHNDASAVGGSIIALCQQGNVSSQAACALLRTLIEGCLSVFAFCKDPNSRAKLYWDFRAVLDWRFACLDEVHFGCPLSPSTAEKRQKIDDRKQRSKSNILRLGKPYLVPKAGRNLDDRLNEAVMPGNEAKRYFRDTWYPEKRKELLAAENMGWLYDVIYQRLCSAVHSDSGASKVLAGLQRSHAVTVTIQYWSAAIYRLVDELGLHLPAEKKGILHKYYMDLQFRP